MSSKSSIFFCEDIWQQGHRFFNNFILKSNPLSSEKKTLLLLEKNSPSSFSIPDIIFTSYRNIYFTQPDWNVEALVKVIYPKYSKHWPYTVASTIDCGCIKMLNHGLYHGFLLSPFKLIPCPIHWIVCVLAYLNFIFEF